MCLMRLRRCCIMLIIFLVLSALFRLL
jgi:hypothetical protein